jgi:SSS family solute:Na+ symporter
LKTLAALDLLVLGAYLVGITGYGCWFYLRNRESEHFMSAGRSLPGWAVGLSIFGSYVSSISFLAVPGRAFAGNWSGYVSFFALPLAVWITCRWFVPFYRRQGEVSAYHHLEARFGPWARTYAVACYMLTQTARLGTILYLLALALVPLTGWDIRLIIVGAGLVILVYPLLGGTEAVIWTGVVQAVVLVGGALACVAVLLFKMPGGPAEVFNVATAHGKFSLGDFGASLAQPTFWVLLAYGFLINLQGFGVDQSYVQRYATARAEADARRSVWIGGLLYLPVGAMFFFIGTALFSFYTAQPSLLPPGFDPVARPDAVFPHFISAQLPAGLAGLVVAGLCAAAMDSNLNCMATLYLKDIHIRYLRPRAGERESMAALYGSTLLFGLLGIAAALAMISIKNALDLWWELAGIFGGGVLGLFLLSFLPRVSPRAALAGVLAGVVTTVWLALSPRAAFLPAELRNPLHPFLTNIVGTGVLVVVGLLLASRLRRPTPA